MAAGFFAKLFLKKSVYFRFSLLTFFSGRKESKRGEKKVS